MRIWCQRGFAMLLIMAVATAGNLHLPIVQAVAWSRMYSQYREHYSPEVAMEITLSGQYPCALCKYVQSAETERSKQSDLTTLTFHDLLPLPNIQSAVAVAPSPQRSWTFQELESPLPKNDNLPEVPPPRLA